MLRALSLQNVVLIDKLEISFGPGLTVFTGETGAGKSILLDGLGLALGVRADPALLAAGAAEAAATASFLVPTDHPVHAVLTEQGLASDAAGTGEPLLLRRVLTHDGRSRAFINDQPVSVGLLRRVGSALVEMQGQHTELGIAEPIVQRALLDAFGVDPRLCTRVREAWSAWRGTRRAAEEARARTEQAKAQSEWLGFTVGELDALAPEAGEEERLAAERQALQGHERRGEALAAALAEITSRDRRIPHPAAAVRVALRALARLVPPPAAAIAALERAEAALGEAETAIEREAETAEQDPALLERTESRLFALRAAARKHNVMVADLSALAAKFHADLAALDTDRDKDAARAAEEVAARSRYIARAEALSAARRAAASCLEAAIGEQLAPLRLENARFSCQLTPLAEADWGPEGIESVMYLLAANPGQEPAPLARAASGGELARLMLALKVVLVRARNPGTLIFDEVDSGIGGATAAAVGERLAAIAERTQLIVVTHSPQVAVHGAAHFRITKDNRSERTLTSVIALDAAARQEEIARMLAGSAVTGAARAAAASLLAQPKTTPRRRRASARS